jgi:NADH/NAD ratio-sensing transcriptional regulator Rex
MIIDVPAIETVTDEGDTDVPILTVPAESASDVPDAAAADSDVPVTQ